MREAVGGAALLYLILPLIALFVCLTAFVMNYASTYRAANYVVTQIENYQGEIDASSVQEELWSKYHYMPSKGKSIEITSYGNGKGTVYRVELPVTFDVPVLGEVTIFTVTAETKTIYGIS